MAVSGFLSPCTSLDPQHRHPPFTHSLQRKSLPCRGKRVSPAEACPLTELSPATRVDQVLREHMLRMQREDVARAKGLLEAMALFDPDAPWEQQTSDKGLPHEVRQLQSRVLQLQDQVTET